MREVDRRDTGGRQKGDKRVTKGAKREGRSHLKEETQYPRPLRTRFTQHCAGDRLAEQLQ